MDSILLISYFSCMYRYLKDFIAEDLKKKMVFISGPRQVGKTTLALSFLKNTSPTENPAYINWDRTKSRAALLKGELPSGESLLVFDEIHKYRGWKNLIKGLWDTENEFRRFIVTGSAMLNLYRRGQDSMLGRYFHYRLHPFTVSEAKERNVEIDQLLQLGGFPEPLFSGSERTWRRWNKERVEKIIYEDIRDLEDVKTLELIELLAEELPKRVGAPLSIKSLKEDLQKAHETVESWITILERVYFCFRIPPFGAPKVRAVKKEQKLYLWDWRGVEDTGFRFENLVASHLLKYCHFLEDTEGHKMELRFLRDTDGREIDFVVLKDKKPIFAVECKSGEQAPSKNIHYFKERTNIPKFYQVHLGQKHYEPAPAIEILPFTEFCKKEHLP